jgi:GST-like protein
MWTPPLPSRGVIARNSRGFRAFWKQRRTSRFSIVSGHEFASHGGTERITVILIRPPGAERETGEKASWERRAAMSIELHTWNTPNGRKISVALEEMGLPYTVKTVNISKGEQFEPGFVKISPNSKIPAIVDPEGPGGAPISIFESGAILIYLGEKTGKFWPGDLRRQVPVLEWLMWQMGGFGPMPGQVHHFLQVANEADRRYGLERYSKETRRLYGVLDKRLGEVEFAGGEVSIDDFAILGWAWRHERHQVDLADFPNVKRWYETIMARPGVQRGFAVALS